MAPRVPRPTNPGHKQGQVSAPATATAGTAPSTVPAGIAPAPAPKRAPASMLAAPTDSEMTPESGAVACSPSSVTRRKLQTPGNADEHKRQQTPTINPTL